MDPSLNSNFIYKFDVSSPTVQQLIAENRKHKHLDGFYSDFQPRANGILTFQFDIPGLVLYHPENGVLKALAPCFLRLWRMAKKYEERI